MNIFSDKAKLIKGCIANERQAQESLYHLFYTKMLRLCCRYLKSNDLAKEAVNTGFLKVFQNISTFDSKKGELGAWIRTIIVRTCIDLNRKEAKFNEVNSIEGEIDYVFIAPDVLDKLYAQDLVTVIKQLPNATRLVFNLSVVEGYSHKEIAEQLQISESTSRWHLSEAKKQLRAMLESPHKSTNEPTEYQNKTT